MKLSLLLQNVPFFMMKYFKVPILILREADPFEENIRNIEDEWPNGKGVRLSTLNVVQNEFDP